MMNETTFLRDQGATYSKTELQKVHMQNVKTWVGQCNRAVRHSENLTNIWTTDNSASSLWSGGVRCRINWVVSM